SSGEISISPHPKRADRSSYGRGLLRPFDMRRQSMNKATKGTIAAGAAVLLLLGTGGTLAYWNDTADLGGQTITAGQLQVEQQGTAAWELNGAPIAETDLAGLRIVPGDELTYVGEFEITAAGRNLAFDIELASGAISAATSDDAADIALAAALTDSATFTVNDS